MSSRVAPAVDSRGDSAAPSAAQLAALDNLRTVLFRWPEAGSLILGVLSPPLDSTYFNSTVRPAIQAAGCTACHNGNVISGTTPDISGKHFSVYNDLVQLNGLTTGVIPVASRAILSAKLGKRLLSQTFATTGILAGSVGVAHNISFQPVNLAINETRVTHWVSPETIDPRLVLCQGPCPPGEISEPTTCRTLSGISCAPCGKKKCQVCLTVYWRDWNCIRYEDFPNEMINVRVNSVQTEPLTGQSRFLSSEGTLQ